MAEECTQVAGSSAAVAVIVDHSAYDVRYSYRPLSGIAVVSMSIYLFTVSNWSVLLTSEVWSAVDACHLFNLIAVFWRLSDIHRTAKVYEKVNGKCPDKGTRRHNSQLLHRYTDPDECPSAQRHTQTDRRHRHTACSTIGQKLIDTSSAWTNKQCSKESVWLISFCGRVIIKL